MTAANVIIAVVALLIGIWIGNKLTMKGLVWYADIGQTKAQLALQEFFIELINERKK